MKKGMRGDCGKRYFSPAERIGFGAFVLAALLYLVDPHLSVLPLWAFLLLCFMAPFLPGVGFFLPVVSRGNSTTDAVALTFDDGPDPATTRDLLSLLDKHHASATFFVNGNKALRHPDIIREILLRGHLIGNHTFSHDNFIMMKSGKALHAEIMKAQQALEPFGIIPHAFRPPVGVISPRLAPVLRKTGMYVLNFSRRAGDRGNRRVDHISRRILKHLRAGDIIMLHDTRPHNGQDERWLAEVDRVLAGIKEKGLRVVPLSELIGRSVMEKKKG